MPNLSFADITYEQGLMLLYARKQALDRGQLPKTLPAALPLWETLLEKRSWEAKDLWRGLSKATQNVILSGAGGAGLGAGLGWGSAALQGADDSLRRALHGGLAGGAIGSGLGLYYNPEAGSSIYNQLFAPAAENPPAAAKNPPAAATNPPAAAKNPPAPIPDAQVPATLQSEKNRYNNLSAEAQAAEIAKLEAIAQQPPLGAGSVASVAAATVPGITSRFNKGPAQLDLQGTYAELLRRLKEPPKSSISISAKQMGDLFNAEQLGSRVYGPPSPLLNLTQLRKTINSAQLMETVLEKYPSETSHFTNPKDLEARITRVFGTNANTIKQMNPKLPPGKWAKLLSYLAGGTAGVGVGYDALSRYLSASQAQEEVWARQAWQKSLTPKGTP